MADTKTQTMSLTNLSGWKAARKALGRRLQREDFPKDDAGWASFCDYRIWLNKKALSRAKRAVDFYTSVRAGEHLAAAVAKLDAVSDLTKELDAKNAELARMKEELAKLQQLKK